MTDWATEKARKWIDGHKFELERNGMPVPAVVAGPRNVASLAALLDEVTIERTVERDSAEVGFNTMRAEREAALAQVAALREALKSIARHVRRGMAPAGHMSLEEIAVRDANVVIYDTQAAAEAHDAEVRASGYRVGLERAAQIAESADNLHQWPGSEAQQIAAAIRALSAPAQEETP